MTMHKQTLKDLRRLLNAINEVKVHSLSGPKMPALIGAVEGCARIVEVDLEVYEASQKIEKEPTR